jgi:hypothetical protein
LPEGIWWFCQGQGLNPVCLLQSPHSAAFLASISEAHANSQVHHRLLPSEWNLWPCLSHLFLIIWTWNIYTVYNTHKHKYDFTSSHGILRIASQSIISHLFIFLTDKASLII